MPAINQLIRAYPAYVRVRDLEIDGEEEEKLELAHVLAANGVVTRIVPPKKA